MSWVKTSRVVLHGIAYLVKLAASDNSSLTQAVAVKSARADGSTRTVKARCTRMAGG